MDSTSIVATTMIDRRNRSIVQRIPPSSHFEPQMQILWVPHPLRREGGIVGSPHHDHLSKYFSEKNYNGSMADCLYYSLWFPNFRLISLPEKLVSVMQQLPHPLVTAASVYPLDWQQSPTFQRVYIAENEELAEPEQAAAEVTEILHEDSAYEFELPWKLWYPESDGLLDPIWKEEVRIVRVVGLGPQFDGGSYEQNGHIRVDLGLDTPFICDDIPLHEDDQIFVKKNIQQLVDFTTQVEKNCGVETRLLWTESEESLAQKLIARLQKLN